MRTTVAISYQNNKTILISSFLAAAIFIFQIMGRSSLVSLCFMLSIMLVVVNYAFRVLMTRKMSPYVLILAVLMLFSLVYAGLRLDFDWYKRAIIVLCCIICIDDSNRAKLKLTEFRFIEVCFLIAIAYANYMYYIGGLGNVFFETTQIISMNFSNPNACGMWLTMFFVSFLISLFIEPNIFVKVLLTVGAISIFPILLATGSRNALLSCVFIIGMAVLIKMFPAIKIPSWILAILTVLPTIVYLFYMYVILPNINAFNELLSFIVSVGKTLGSRSRIWQIIENNFTSCFLLGKYNTFYDEQLHNSLMTLYCMFGALFTILICVFFYKTLKQKNTFSQSALLAVWLTGCFEASVFVGVAGIYLMLQILPVIGESALKKRSCLSNFK